MSRVVLRCLALLAALLALPAQAVTYTFNTNGNPAVSGTPSICSGNWSRTGGSTFNCDGDLSTASGDVLTVSSATTITVNARRITLTGTTVGATDRAINLRATSNPITATNSTVIGTLTATSGSISLTGGSVSGLVLSNCCAITTNGTNLSGGARSDSNRLSITGGVLQGPFFAGNNPATFTGVNMLSGSVSGASTITFNDSTLGSPTSYVAVTSANGPVSLNTTTAYGNFTAPGSSTIEVNSPSTVTGTCSPGSTPANACRPVPILNWALDESQWTGAAGEVLDGTPNGLSGAAAGGATTARTSPALPQVNAQGTCGYGVFNAASSQYVQRADSNLLDLQGSFTIGVWVRPRTRPTSGLMSILSKDENYEFHLNPDGTINWWWQTSGPNATREFNSSTALPTGQWSHVLIRYAPGDQRIYINGNLAGQASFSGTPVINNDPLQLGADQNFAGRYFNGELDELRIYNVALSEAQIAALVAERHPCGLNLQCFSDNFNDGSLGEDWAVASRGATAFTPTVSGQRMRLTSNQGNVSTSSTLQRLFPAAGNYIQVQFKYYAYNGSGADGVAVVLSDASVTPQPGAFGGPLGYGTRGDAANPGFAGGWLGVGIDEYGNFSTEGGPGGPGRISDSVAIRGSGSSPYTSGYRYIAGTAAGLNPGVDSASSASAAPGHTYRITLDGRFTSQARVTVERDTGSGFVVLPNLNAVNVLAAANQQAALPSDFYLSLTGSTGGSTNIHELDDLQVCATDIKPIGQQIDHFELVYGSATPLTCNPLPVTVRACANAACTQLYVDPVTVTLSPGAGWVGGMPRIFSGGQATFNLQVTTPGTVSLGVASSSPLAKPNSQTLCSSANCQVEFVDSGFFFSIPTQLANKESQLVTVTARRRNPDTQKCEPSFKSVKRNVSFWSDYLNPGPAEIQGTPQMALRYNTAETAPELVSTASATATVVPLDFDADAQAKIWVRYPDAGKLRLNASHFSEEAYAVGSASFVSKPYGLCLQRPASITGNLSNCSGAACAVFPGGIRAGDSFPLSIRAVGWQADGEALTAEQLCSGNITTPNFRHDSIGLTSAVVAPSGGDNGEVTPLAYNHALGSATSSVHSISEVGVFTITATPPAGAYLDGETVSGGSSDLVGRFIPAYLSAEGSASLTPSCGSAFSYQGQPMGFASGFQPTLTVTARNRSGVVTRNYDRGAFWRLGDPAVGVYASITGVAARDARLATDDGTASLAVAEANNGDGKRIYSWTGERLLYKQALLPSVDDYPFEAEIEQRFPAASLTDADGACHGMGGACQDYVYTFSDQPGSEVRLGRLRLGNAHGSELQSLSLPWVVESWQNIAGGSFQREGMDTCTNLGTPALDMFTGNLALGETIPTLVAGPATGGGSVSLSAPGAGNDGSVQVSFPTSPSWLQYPWDGANRQLARGLASFGIYQGAAPLIFRRELYR